MEPIYWNNAINKLSQIDPILKKIINGNQNNILKSKGDAFSTLVKSIIGQQISVKAAESIHKRLLDQIDYTLTPDSILLANPVHLKATGLSRQKVEYLRNIASYFINNPSATSNKFLTTATIEEITNNLIKIKGIGMWTIEMFLIFYAMKPDIFPIKDIGLLNAMKKSYNIADIKSDNGIEKIIKISNKWKPYRTVATWYLWLYIDNKVIEY
tara:strand:- start:10550 stop:11185 length:636 start_codon:yes stop_codon:yes gene_type:complete